MSLAILAAALTLCAAPHASDPCQIDTTKSTTNCPVASIICAIAAADNSMPPKVQMNMDVEARLSMAYPPCGTPEAKTTAACIKWVVVPCPQTRTMWSPVLPPIGCDPSVLVRFIPGDTK